jgi:NADPH2:quinone reductase
VLSHSEVGGTGQAAVKMAKHYGATVIAAASPGKHETAPWRPARASVW